MSHYALSDQSIAVREAANAAMRLMAEHAGLGRFRGLTETPGVPQETVGERVVPPTVAPPTAPRSRRRRHRRRRRPHRKAPTRR